MIASFPASNNHSLLFEEMTKTQYLILQAIFDNNESKDDILNYFYNRFIPLGEKWLFETITELENRTLIQKIDNLSDKRKYYYKLTDLAFNFMASLR